MDWRDHENFNTGLLILASLMALAVTLAGFVLLPYRFGRVRSARVNSAFTKSGRRPWA
jgi:hypothetical protein